VRTAFSGVDGSWHHLRERLAQPGVATFAINRALQSIDELDGQLHKLLGYVAPPAAYYGQGPAPTGAADLKRLATALADRAAFLAGVVQADLPPTARNRDLIIQRSIELNRASGAFLQAVSSSDDRDFLQNAFSSVAAMADPLERDFAASIAPPRVSKAWEGFVLVEAPIRQNLGMAAPPQLPNAPAASGPDAIRALADQLAVQADAFLQGFAPTAGVVPEGAFFLADAGRLRASAEDFRQDAARGLNLTQLAYEFRDLDASWQRLARRVVRIARGRTGPNIQRALAMGDTLAELHRLLAVPGYPPDLRGPAMQALPPAGVGPEGAVPPPGPE
jgi:hypothetical protein